jgi:hypothetical protein
MLFLNDSELFIPQSSQNAANFYQKTEAEKSKDTLRVPLLLTG